MISLCNYCDRHTSADGLNGFLTTLLKVEYQEASGKAMTPYGGNASNQACNVRHFHDVRPQGMPCHRLVPRRGCRVISTEVGVPHNVGTS